MMSLTKDRFASLEYFEALSAWRSSELQETIFEKVKS